MIHQSRHKEASPTLWFRGWPFTPLLQARQLPAGDKPCGGQAHARAPSCNEGEKLSTFPEDLKNWVEVFQIKCFL